MTAYAAIREILDYFGVYRKDEELLDSKEELLCWYAQQVDESKWDFAIIKEKTREFLDAVQRYVEPKKGDAYCSRTEILRLRDELKRLLK